MPEVPRRVASFPSGDRGHGCLHELSRQTHVACRRETPMKRQRSFMAMVSEYTALAFLLPASTFVGYAIGYLLDKAFGTHYLYLVFLLIGIASGFVQLIRQFMRDSRDDDGS